MAQHIHTFFSLLKTVTVSLTVPYTDCDSYSVQTSKCLFLCQSAFPVITLWLSHEPLQYLPVHFNLKKKILFSKFSQVKQGHRTTERPTFTRGAAQVLLPYYRSDVNVNTRSMLLFKTQNLSLARSTRPTKLKLSTLMA